MRTFFTLQHATKEKIEMIIKMINEFKLTVFHLRAQT